MRPAILFHKCVMVVNCVAIIIELLSVDVSLTVIWIRSSA